MYNSYVPFNFRKRTNEDMKGCKGPLFERFKTTEGNDNWTADTQEKMLYIL
jgi:hypothetical protein